MKTVSANPPGGNSDPPSEATQQNMLTLVATSDAHCRTVVDRIGLDLFGEVLRPVAAAAYGYVKKFGKAPGVSHLHDELESILTPKRNDDKAKKKAELVSAILDNIEALAADSFNPDYVVTQIDVFMQRREVQKALVALYDASEAGDVGAAKEVTQRLLQRIEGKPKHGPSSAVTIDKFLAMDLPDLPKICGDWLCMKGTVEVIGESGIGKTFFCQHIAWCLSECIDMPGLGWPVPQACKVYYYDAEMAGQDMQKRWDSIRRTLPSKQKNQKNLIFFNQDLHVDAEGHPLPMPNLATPEGAQWMIDECLEHGIQVLFIDNAGAAFQTAEGENSDTHWDAVNRLLLRLRANGVATILPHHPGKDLRRGGSGSAKQTRVLTTEIYLDKVDDPADQGQTLRLNVRFGKWRNPRTPQGYKGYTQSWSVIDLGRKLEYGKSEVVVNPKDDQLKRARMLHKQGKSYREIAEELGLGKSTIAQWLR